MVATPYDIMYIWIINCGLGDGDIFDEVEFEILPGYFATDLADLTIRTSGMAGSLQNSIGSPDCGGGGHAVIG